MLINLVWRGLNERNDIAKLGEIGEFHNVDG